jgi:hypothetical protein
MDAEICVGCGMEALGTPEGKRRGRKTKLKKQE